MELNNNFLSFSFLLFFACCLHCAYVNGAREPNKPYYKVPVKSLQPSSNCVGSNHAGSTVGSQKLPVTFSYGPCSPLGHEKKIPNSDQVFSQDKARVNFINGRTTSHRYPTGESASKLPTAIDLASATYFVKIGFGTPKRSYTVMIDTGSDITWIQCQPCSSNCYSQQEPIFDPSLSSSYTNGSCKSGYENKYHIKYGDKSYSNGLYGCDIVTFDNSDVFSNFQFGCGQDNVGDFGKAAGVLGLGQGDLSFVSQTASKFGKYFSYCLPPTPSSTGYLLFGDKATTSSSSSRKFTPLVKNDNDPYYFVNLIGISVGGKKLNVSGSVFSSSPGTIIDSGTVITRLPQSAYLALKYAFQESMSQYPHVPPPLYELLDTCYNLQGYDKMAIPKVVLHFEGGADVTLDPSGIVTPISKTQFCLAFAAKDHETDLAIIGNTQQRAMDVLYDINGGRIGFGMNGCHS